MTAASGTLDFVIAGVQKAATTALLAKLSRHPGLCCATPKELHLFDDDRRDWTAALRPDLTRHFPGCAPDLLWGEATPAYVYWPGAIERLAAYNPGARIIVSLRHPAWRALSGWKMEVARGKESLSFAAAISGSGRARVKPVHRHFSYVERGFYAPQIARILQHFPARNVFFLRMEDLFQDEAAVMGALFAFLGVAKAPVEGGPKYVVPVDSGHVALDARAEIAFLSALYEADMRETARLTGLALGHWLDGSYEEGYLGAVRGVPLRTPALGGVRS